MNWLAGGLTCLENSPNPLSKTSTSNCSSVWVIAMFMRRMATLLPKLMSSKVRVELMPETQGRKYNRVNVDG